MHLNSHSFYNAEAGRYTREENTGVGYSSEVLPRRSGCRVVPRSAAMAQTTSAVATAIAIEGEKRAAKKAKRSPEVYLPLPDVSVNLKLKLCLSLGDVRLFLHTLPAQNQWTLSTSRCVCKPQVEVVPFPWGCQTIYTHFASSESIDTWTRFASSRSVITWTVSGRIVPNRALYSSFLTAGSGF